MEIFSPRLAAATLFGIIAAWWGHVWGFVLFTLGAVLLDYTTGLIAGRATEGLNSKKAVKGLYKKVGILILLFLGLFLDAAVNHFMAHSVDFFEIPFELPISHIVTIWIVITEAISVCENLERLHVPIPKWIVKILRKAEKQIDKNEEENTNNG
jgi:toxin secretion/phage lysis holin